MLTVRRRRSGEGTRPYTGMDGSIEMDATGAAALRLPDAVRPATRVIDRGRDWLLHRLLLVADVFGLSAAFVAAQLLFLPNVHVHDLMPPATESLVFIASLPVWIFFAMICGLYHRDATHTDHSTVDDVVGVFAVVTTGAWVSSAVAWWTHAAAPDPPRMVSFWLMAIALVVTSRAVARALARRSDMYLQNVVIVGAGDVGQLIGRKLQQHPEYGIRLIGFVDSRPKKARADLSEPSLLGSPEQLPEIVQELKIDRVIIAYSDDSHHHLLKLVHRLKALSVHIDLVPRLFEAVGPKVEMHTVEALPLIGLPPVRLTPSERYAKRAIDLVLTTVALVLTAPLFAYVAWRIKRDSPGPIFFRQVRVGLNMREFTALKFRTMREGVDSKEHREYIRSTMSSMAVATNGLYKLDRSDEITPFGRWLRKTSIDELPQFLNVLRGDMSLVGPRPCIPYETEGFAPHHFERFLVMPGITGLWQVTARARSSFGEALDMDVAYARGWSLGGDLSLLFRTPPALLRQTRHNATS